MKNDVLFIMINGVTKILFFSCILSKPEECSVKRVQDSVIRIVSMV